MLWQDAALAKVPRGIICDRAGINFYSPCGMAWIWGSCFRLEGKAVVSSDMLTSRACVKSRPLKGQ